MPENCAGENEKIAEPTERYWDNAPQGSTCIRIMGTYDGNPVEYRVYPGGNLTSDFNLRRNHRYILNIAVCGNNFSDLRQSTCLIEITPLPATGHTGVFYSGGIDIISVNEPEAFYTLSYRNTGNVGSCSVASCPQPGVNYPVIEGGGSFFATVSAQATRPGRIEVTLTITDRYGREFVRTLSMQIN